MHATRVDLAYAVCECDLKDLKAVEMSLDSEMPLDGTTGPAFQRNGTTGHMSDHCNGEENVTGSARCENKTAWGYSLETIPSAARITESALGIKVGLARNENR